MSGLAELVEELALGRVEYIDEGRAYTAPLLAQLKDAVFGDVGGTKGGASSGSPIPLDAAAFTLWEDITGQIAAQFEGATDLRPNHNSPMMNLLGWWTAFSAAVYRTDRGAGDEVDLLAREVASERLESWAARIRAHFVPQRTKEITVACPNCGMDRVTLGEGILAVEVFALQALVPTDGSPITVVCQNPACGHQWIGDTEVIHLGRLSGVDIDVEAIRESRAPVIATVMDDERREEPFDPTNPEHMALIRDTPRKSA